MSTVLAITRPTDFNLPLFVHVLGAMLLVGGLLTSTSALAYARGDTRFLRLGYWTLLAVALPGWVVMRVGAQWIYSKGYDELDPEPAWIVIGGITADLGGVLFLIALGLGGYGVYRLRERKGEGFLKAAMIISIVLLAAYVVAVWAMAGKPD